MLKVYSAPWCPHCVRTIDYLKDRNIEFEKIDIEEQPDHIVQQVIDANGGKDWVIPTLEYNGKWREGKTFDAKTLEADLKRLGVVHT